VDETAAEKSSADCVGAARQYSGTAGGVALCQVAVTLSYATSRGHALIGRSLYLPEACAADEEHRELAGVPEEVMFATKPELAGALLQRAHQRGIRAAFVTGDEVYGGRDLRRAIRALGMGYVLAVRANHALTPGSGRTVTAAGAVRLIPRSAWQRMRTGHGTKGSRHYDWAMLEVTGDDAPGGHDAGCSALLVRRHRYTGTCSFYRCWTPGPVPLARLIATAVARWRIEEGPGTAGPRSACSPTSTSTSPWRSPCNASTTSAQTWTPDWSRSPSRNCCGSCATPSSRHLGETGPTGCTGPPGDATTSTAPARPTSAGTPTPRQDHDHNELQLPYLTLQL
jgi:hypothetical protein